MPVLDKYRQIQSQLAAKKARGEELSTIQDQALTHIDQNIKLKPEVNPPVVPPVAVNNEPTTPEIVPQAPIVPEPVVPPVVEPIKQETPVVPKPVEAPKETPMTTEDTVKQAQSWIGAVPPKGFEYGNLIDPKTGQPQLVNTAEIKRQKKLAKNRSLYTSGQSLNDGIKSGNILPGTDEFADLQATNPQVFADYEAIKKQEQEAERVKNVGRIIMGDPVETKQSSTLTDLLDKVSSGLDEDIMTQYKNMVTNNEEYVSANTKVTDLSTQLAKVENDMNVIGEDMRKKITGETPESVIASKIAREAKPLLDKATYLQNQLEIAQADANRIMADNKGMFEIQMADRADKRNLAFQLYNTINAEEIRQEDIAREDDRIIKEINLEEYRYQRDLADGNAIRAEERKNKLEDLKAEQEYNLGVGLMQVGVDPTGLTPEEMKAEYVKSVKASQAAASQADNLKTQIELAKLNKGNWTIEKINGKDVRVNKDTGEVLPITTPSNSKYGVTPTANGVQINVESTEDIPQGRRQCGAYVNDALYGGSATGVMKDSLESKLAATGGNTTPVPGSAFVMDFGDAEQPGENGMKYGHTGVVEEVRADGIVISDMNRQNNEEFRRVFVPFDSKEYSYIKGFAVPPQAESGTQQYTDIQEIQLPEKASQYTKDSFGFGVRMSQAEKSIKNMEEKFKKSTSLTEWLGGKYPNWMKTNDRQLFEQAKRNFVNSVLRNESGAVISDAEFANADLQYFPQPGDSEAVMNQKAQNRKASLLKMFNSAGKTESGESIRDIYNSLDITNEY